MSTNRLLLPILIPLLFIVQKCHAQCNCNKNSIFKNVHGSNQQTWPNFEEIFKNGKQKMSDAQNQLTSTNSQQPSIELQSLPNLMKKPLELQIPISSISVANSKGVSFQPGLPNFIKSHKNDYGGELQLINEKPSTMFSQNQPCASQNAQLSQGNFIPITVTLPSSVIESAGAQNQPSFSNFAAFQNSYAPQQNLFSNAIAPNFALTHQNLVSSLDDAGLVRTSLFQPNTLLQTNTAGQPQVPVVYLVQAQMPTNIPQYVTTMNYPTAASTSKSLNLKSLIPLLINMLNDNKCGCNCPNCPNCGGRFKKEQPTIHGGYAKKNVYGQAEKVIKQQEDSGEKSQEKAADLIEDTEKKTETETEDDSGEYYDADDPEFRNESKENESKENSS